MIINSGVTNITRVPAFEIGNRYEKYDVVYYSGYDYADVSYPCSQAESGHYYYSGDAASTSTTSNRPNVAATEWTTGFFAKPSYGATVDYEGLSYTTEYGDGYYNILNRSLNSLRATFSVNFDKRTDKEAKAILFCLEDSFNKGDRPSGGYSGIPWTPFAPYNQSGEFFVESFTHGYDTPDVNSVNTTFYNENVSLTNWKTLYIPYENTREQYFNGRPYFHHDAAFAKRASTDSLPLLPAQSGWYYFTGEKHPDYTPATGIEGTRYNSPTGANSLWTKNNFYFEVNQGLQIPQNPRFTKQDLQNKYSVRFSDGINKNLLSFSADFKGRSDKEAQAMVHFLEHHQGVNLFNFTPPAPYDFTDKVFIAPRWKHQINFKDNNDINIEMREFPVDYLNIKQTFSTLVTVVNQAVREDDFIPASHASGPTGPRQGSISVSQRQELNEFVANTGFSTCVITGQVLRTGFYVTNSGSDTIRTTLFYDTDKPAGYTSQAAFEFPSGRVDIKPGQNAFIPFYFKGIQQNNATGPLGVSGPSLDGKWEASVSCESRSVQNGAVDLSGTINVNITGYVTGWLGSVDSSSPPTTAYGNPLKGGPDQNPMHPSKFLVQTGFHNVSGIPLNVLKWEHPQTGHNLTHYRLEYTQDPWGDSTGIRDEGVPTGINSKFMHLTDGSTTIDVDLYTGLLVPPTLMGDSAIPKRMRNTLDPQSTGVRQAASFTHLNLQTDSDYYYRIRSEYADWAGVVADSSMYVYASGVSDFEDPVAESVWTGLGTTSADYTVAKTAIHTTPKPAFQIYLPHRSNNLNLSGVFIKELVNRGVVKQVDGEDMSLIGGNYIDIANTGAYADHFTGIHYIMPAGTVVGSTDITSPAIETGDQLLTGVVNPADAGAGADPNLQKPVAETPTVLIMKKNSAVVGQGGTGGDGGWTMLTAAFPSDETFTTYGDQQQYSKDYKYTLNLTIDGYADSTAGGEGGTAIKITHSDIALFKIRKDYNAKIYAGGGGGGGGDRFSAEKAFSASGAVQSIWRAGYGFNYQDPEAMGMEAGWSQIDVGVVYDPKTQEMRIKESVFGYFHKNLYYKTSDFLGIHKGGAGGGGAGFDISNGGEQLDPSLPMSSVNVGTDGGYKKAGVGNRYMRNEGGVQNNRFSRGGNGGNYGQKGSSGEKWNSETLNTPFVFVDASKGQDGGNPGFAIHIDSNSNYTVSNFRQNLLVITPSRTGIVEVPGLVAHFDAGSNVVKNVGGDAAAAGDPVYKWTSINDSNVYLEQTTSANQPTLKDGDTSDNKVGDNAVLGDSAAAVVKHSFFNNQKYVYFSTDSESTLEYLKLYNATADINNSGDIRVNYATGYAVGDYTSSGITVEGLPSDISANVVIVFGGGAVFKVSANASASATTLYGTLEGDRIDHEEWGYYRLSSLSSGFDIFYVMYPNRWMDATGDFTALATDKNSQANKDEWWQTGWVRFSTARSYGLYYNRNNGRVYDNTGLGVAKDGAGAEFTFADWTAPASRGVGWKPTSAWIYQLSSSRSANIIRVEAKNNGVVVGSSYCEGSAFGFNASGEVYIGASVSSSSQDLAGFRGAIAAIVIYNRRLSTSESRIVIGNLLNKYIHIKTTDVATEESAKNSPSNTLSDTNGIAGQIWMT